MVVLFLIVFYLLLGCSSLFSNLIRPMEIFPVWLYCQHLGHLVKWWSVPFCRAFICSHVFYVAPWWALQHTAITNMYYPKLKVDLTDIVITQLSWIPSFLLFSFISVFLFLANAVRPSSSYGVEITASYQVGCTHQWFLVHHTTLLCFCQCTDLTSWL